MMPRNLIHTLQSIQRVLSMVMMRVMILHMSIHRDRRDDRSRLMTVDVERKTGPMLNFFKNNYKAVCAYACSAIML